MLLLDKACTLSGSPSIEPMRSTSSQLKDEELYPSKVSFSLQPAEKRALYDLSKKVLTRKGDYRFMLLILARCALTHYDVIQPYLNADIRYATAEGLDVCDVWKRKLDTRWKGTAK